MGLWIARVELDDRCGQLGALAGAISGIGASIVDLDIHRLGGGRVADELVIDVPVPVDAPLVGQALEQGGAHVLRLQPADPHQLRDRSVQALDVTAGVVGHGAATADSLGRAAARLIDAELAWVGPPPGFDPPPVAADAMATGSPVRGRLFAKRLGAGPNGGESWVLAVPVERPGGGRMVVMVLRRNPPFSFTETARLQALLRVVNAGIAGDTAASKPASAVTVDLDDGGQVAIRDLRRDDAPALVRLHARCSDLTRYRRYLTPKPRLGSPVLDQLLDVDGRDRIGLCAAAGTEILGLVNLLRYRDAADSGEIAVVVEDGHQRRGIGTVLIDRLLQRAAAVGIERLVAVTQPDNEGIARLLGRVATQVHARHVDGLRHLTIQAPSPAALVA